MSSRTRSVSRPFGDRFTWPSPSSGAVATKNMCWRADPVGDRRRDRGVHRAHRSILPGSGVVAAAGFRRRRASAPSAPRSARRPLDGLPVGAGVADVDPAEEARRRASGRAPSRWPRPGARARSSRSRRARAGGRRGRWRSRRTTPRRPAPTPAPSPTGRHGRRRRSGPGRRTPWCGSLSSAAASRSGRCSRAACGERRRRTPSGRRRRRRRSATGAGAVVGHATRRLQHGLDLVGARRRREQRGRAAPGEEGLQRGGVLGGHGDQVKCT